MALLLSASERKFIGKGIEQDVRNDGRQRMDHRYFDLKTNVVLNANGSARLKLDHTDVLVAVKVGIEECSVSAPDVGRVECSVDCAPSASLRFEGRGADTLNVQLTTGLERMLRRAIDVKSLCIVPKLQCWVVYVDATVLDSSGSLADAVSMAAYAALNTTTIPSIEVVKGDQSAETIIEVSDDPFETTPLVLHHVPITVSLTKVGSCFVVDASAEEEACKSAGVTFTVDAEGMITSTSKSGTGGISPAMLMEMMKVASKSGVALIKRIDQVIERNEKRQ